MKDRGSAVLMEMVGGIETEPVLMVSLGLVYDFHPCLSARSVKRHHPL